VRPSFFFSSRRRHTRFSRDWSSDVCSSDLLPGYGGSQLFFADLLDRLGVNVHIFRVGTHKAAVEPFMLNGMSEESRSNNQQLAEIGRASCGKECRARSTA